MNAIEVQHLNVGYGDQVLLQDLNFSIAQGGRYLLFSADRGAVSRAYSKIYSASISP